MKVSINKMGFGIVCLILFSCNKNFYPGDYSRSIENSSYEVFKIKTDSSFEYSYRSGWNKNNSIGKWSRHGNYIVLNSEYKRNSLPINVYSTHQENTNVYLFKFKKYFSRNENPNLWQTLILNDKDSLKIIDSVMNITYPNEIKTFKVEISTTEYLNDTTGMNRLSTENYILQSKNENEFILNYPFDWNMSYYRDFSNERFRIKHKGIYWPAKQQKYNFK